MGRRSASRLAALGCVAALAACGGRIDGGVNGGPSSGRSSPGAGGTSSGWPTNPGPAPLVPLTGHAIPLPGASGGYTLSGIWAAGPADAWVVGTQVLPSSAQPLYFHWDGAKWSTIPGPGQPDGGPM